MATRLKSALTPPALVIGLADPGMTPLLRAGLGGLAASLRARLLARHPRATWPSPVPLGSGTATVEPHRITVEWGTETPEVVLSTLFEASFRITHQLIDLPGTYDPATPPRPELAVALQAGLKRTFLQHGKTTQKAGVPTVLAFEVDDRPYTVSVQGYARFVHQHEGVKAVIESLKSGTVALAGWAYPGAAQRHIAFKATKLSYTSAQALAACFAPVGCLSYAVPSTRGGAVVVLEPDDLVRFAVTRPRLTPRRFAEAWVAGVGDAVLAVQLALRMDQVGQGRPGVAHVHGIMLAGTPWAPQQKNRTATLSLANVPDNVLDTYRKAAQMLPPHLWERQAKGKAGEDGDATVGGLIIQTSALRAFVTDNLARGVPWYRGFATATTGTKKPRFIHRVRSREGDNLGALYPSERKGLIAMIDDLDEAERLLVHSVHTALRQRFGAIASENQGNLAAMRNRFQGERDRWRLAFAGAKTPERLRAALADLWSRGGPNAELRSGWERVLPLLRPAQWQTARDLALVALASYGRAEEEHEAGEDATDEPTDQRGETQP